MKSHFASRGVVTLSILLFTKVVWACSSCGCSLSTDWSSQGLEKTSGLSLDLRLDYLNQDQLRHGTESISVARVNAMAPAAEVEDYTRNQYTTLTLGYTSTEHWSAQISLPYTSRQHQTWGNGGSPSAPQGYVSDFNALGDVKAVVNIYPDSQRHHLGLSVGVKLPTGDHRKTGLSNDGASTVTPVDPGLQPGTGSTDLILGLYYFEPLSRDWDHFEQILYQRAIAGPLDSFRPGDGYNVNIGVRYMSFDAIVPQFQINMRHVNRDSGAIADTVSTGGTLVYLSPGLSVRIAKDFKVYGFIQIPVLQNVTGFQLTPRYTASIGAHYDF